jgi:hypothetical protein
LAAQRSTLGNISVNGIMPKQKKDASRKRNEWIKKNGDFLAIAAVSGLIALLVWLTTIPLDSRPFNFGFGPEMNCQNVGAGEPVCIRRR